MLHVSFSQQTHAILDAMPSSFDRHDMYTLLPNFGRGCAPGPGLCVLVGLKDGDAEADYELM